MRRLFRLLTLFARTSLSAELEYRLNFALSILSSLGHAAGNIFALGLFYRAPTSTLGGWPFEHALLVTGLFMTLQGLSRTLLTPNLSRIVQHVRQGTLDFVLLKPVDTQLWLSLRHASPWGLPDLVFGIGVVATVAVKLQLGAGALLLGATFLVASIVLQYSLWFSLATLSLWFVQIHNVTEVLNALLAAGRYPRSALPAGVYRFVFTFVVPATLLTTVPAAAMLGRELEELPYWTFGLAVASFAWSRWFWKRALRSYASASS